MLSAVPWEPELDRWGASPCQSIKSIRKVNIFIPMPDSSGKRIILTHFLVAVKSPLVVTGARVGAYFPLQVLLGICLL